MAFNLLLLNLDLSNSNVVIKKLLYDIQGQLELKKKIETLARRAVFDRKRGSVNTKDVSKLHMVLSGNPGTGKTMAARRMAGKMN